MNMASLSQIEQPLKERSHSIPSAIESPSKIHLPASPASSPTMITRKASAHARSCSQDMMDPVIENPMSKENVDQKPDLVRKIAEAHTTGQTYVSPSDDIFSPTTRKLNDVKAKRFGSVLPQKQKDGFMYTNKMTVMCTRRASCTMRRHFFRDLR